MFQQAVEQADIAISITDAEANILYVNPAFCPRDRLRGRQIVGANQSLLSNKSTPSTLPGDVGGDLQRAAVEHGQSPQGRQQISGRSCC